MATTITLTLPKPYPAQAAIKRSPAKRKVICAGRRVGKTTLAAEVGTERALAGRQVLFASPVQEQADLFWDRCKAWLAPLLAAGVVVKNETRHLLTFATGGRIRAKTAWDADSLRGDYADFLVLDEAPLMDPAAWRTVGAPMLLDNDGDAWFLGTPKRRNWFHALYQRAIAEAGRWAAFHLTSLDNPFLSAAALAEIAKDMTEDDYDQEILAKFLDSEGVVFRNLAAVLTAPSTRPEDHRGHRLVMGGDWAQRHDFTVLSVGCADCRQEVALDRFNQIGWDIQRDRVMALGARWGVETAWLEANSIGGPNIEALTALVPWTINAFQTTAQSKGPLIKALALCCEQEAAYWLPDAVAAAELAAYEATVNKATNWTTYSAPDDMHDDTVIARALCWHGMTHSSQGFF